MNPNALLVMAKRPQAGKAKTRLTPPLSPETAANLYESFLRDTLDLIRQVKDTQPVIAYLPESESEYFERLAPDFDKILQDGGDLGERLADVTSAYLQMGFKKVVAMDSDSPNLPAQYLEQAFQKLETFDIVLGPCEDGGYYLIGLKAPAPRLFREVQMSTPFVTKDTLKLAKQEGLSACLLPIWYDIDNDQDLRRFVNELADLPPARAYHTRKFLASHYGKFDI